MPKQGEESKPTVISNRALVDLGLAASALGAIALAGVAWGQVSKQAEYLEDRVEALEENQNHLHRLELEQTKIGKDIEKQTEDIEEIKDLLGKLNQKLDDIEE